MSADNILIIYKVNNRKFVGHNCFSECEEDCSICERGIVFTAKNVTEAIKKANDATQNMSMIYEYGYKFKNL